MIKEFSIDNADLWRKRFRTPIILWTETAKAAPTSGLVVSNKSGVYQLYAWDVPTGNLTQLTNRPEGVMYGVLSPDGRFVYYLDDQQGNEIGHYVRVPFEGGPLQDRTPDMPFYSSLYLAVSQGSNLIGMTLANSEGYFLHCIKLAHEGTALSPTQMLYQSKRLIFGPVLSHSGELAVIGSNEHTDKPQFSLFAFDTDSGKQIGELWDGPESSLEAIAFSPLVSDFRLLAATNRIGLKRPLVWNPCTGDRMDLGLEKLAGEVVPLNWSPDGRRILLCQFNHAVEQLYVYDVVGGTLKRLHHPNGTLSSFYGILGKAYFRPEGDIFTQWQDSIHPPQLISLDGETGVKTRTVLSAGEVPPSHPWKSITFTSSDGQSIQGWLGLPEGEGPFPTVLHMHGGPGVVMTEAFSPEAQAWLDHGFAYLTINYRGSTTFGREFQDRIWDNLGHWEVEDMVAARDWLVEKGIARPYHVLLTGWSYGGYLTLLALGKRPNLWAGGMAGVAVADWAMMYEDTPDTLKGFIVAFLGGKPEEKHEKYVASSPITYVENVKAPVLIIQGRNDTRCPSRQVEVYEKRMKSLGKSIEIHWFDSGHIGPRIQNEQYIKYQERMLHFAYRVLSKKMCGG
ncbi:MAG: S9 family peptidase [Candidatus Latescibacteria bacterium]|nr:S9 family peptidase [Candidatus Latescibacterota bacterium]